MNAKFAALMSSYHIKEEKYKEPLKDILLDIFKESNKEVMNQSKLNEKKIDKIEIQLDRLEERYVFEEINKSQYDKFKQKLEQEKEELLKEYDKEGFDLSNLEKAGDKALN